MQWCDFGVLFDFGCAKMVAAAIFEAHINQKDTWIPVTDCYM